MKPLKILHVVLSLEPGGLENGLVNVAAALDPDRFQVDVCCLARGGAFAERLPSTSNVYVIGKGEGFSLRAAYELARIARASKADLLHTHNLGNLIYGAVAKLFGCSLPILHSEHGELAADELSPARVRQRRWLYRCCRMVHAVSDGLREHLIGLGLPADKIWAVLNGVDTTRFFPAVNPTKARQQLGLAANGPVLGIVGRFIATKRHEVLIDAFEQLAQKVWPEAQLVIVGSGGAEQARIGERVRTSPFSHAIHLAGFQSNPCAYYQAMDLLVMPSVIEGMSNVVLEAMACGVPALSHLACGSCEIIEPGETGFLADLQTPNQLEEELRRILGAPDRLLQTGQKAREAVLTRFALARMVSQYESLYAEVAGKRRPLNAELVFGRHP